MEWVPTVTLRERGMTTTLVILLSTGIATDQGASTTMIG